MKYLLISLMFILSVKVFGAEEIKAPAPFTDSEIKRTLKDGTVQNFDGDEYIIIKRGPKKKKTLIAQQETIKTIEIVKEVVKELSPLKNRISLLAGKTAKDGLNLSRSSNIVEVESNVGFSLGLQYQRLLTKRISLGGVLLTNPSALIELGYDF